MRPSLRLVLPMLLSSALAGCVGPMPRWGGSPESDLQAENLFKAGDYEGAMRRYEYLARTAPYPDYYWLQAADAALRAGDGKSAQQLADAINPKELEGTDRTQYALLASRLDLNAGRAKEAMARLNTLGQEQLQTGQAINYHTLRASAYNQLGDMLASAKERVALGSLITQPEALRKNNEAIYDALTRLPNNVLTGKQPPPPDTLGGWMALTQILKSAKPSDINQILSQWRTRYPGHPANGAFLENALRDIGATVTVTPLGNPQTATAVNTSPPSGPFVGVLLPLSGPYAPASKAIRAGLIAAYYADPNPAKPQLHFVDSQANDINQTLQNLAAQGATAMIGPLTKENVTSLANSGNLPIPVLALNQTAGVDNPQVYQFGLTPEHEVEQAAGSAWFDGRQNALVFAPATQFGQRMVKHFTNYWRTLGGKIIAGKTYSHHGSDFANSVTDLLTSLSAPPSSLQSNPTSEGNFIFLIADARDAHSILPQIAAANQGSALPVYATSHVYNGKPDPQADQDLNGLIFCDIPWVLHPSDAGPLSANALEAEIRQTPADYVKLIALGLDAYRLLPELDNAKTNPQYRFSGATGTLSLQAGNRIQRQLECAQFESGYLQPRGTAPVLQPGAFSPARP